MFLGGPAPFPRELPPQVRQAGLGHDVVELLQSVRRNQHGMAFLVFEEECVRSMCEAFGLLNARAPVADFQRRLSLARRQLSPQMKGLLDRYLPIDVAALFPQQPEPETAAEDDAPTQ